MYALRGGKWHSIKLPDGFQGREIVSVSADECAAFEKKHVRLLAKKTLPRAVDGEWVIDKPAPYSGPATTIGVLKP